MMILLTPLVKWFLNIETGVAIILLWGAMFISFLSAVTIGLLSGWQRFADVNIINISSTVIKFVGAVGLVYLGFGASGAVGGLVLAALIGYGISWWLLRPLLGPSESETSELHDDTLTQSVKGYVLPAFFGTLSMAIFGNADMIFAKHHLDGAMTGEYGALSVVAKTIFFVTGVITTVLFAMSAEHEGDRAKSQATFRLAMALTILVAGGATIIFALFPSVVVGTLFGEKYLAVSPLLGWFALAAALYSLASLTMQYLLSLYETVITRYLLALASLEIVSLFFFGETLYAIIGITIVTQILALLLGIFFIVTSHRYVQTDLDRRPGL
jgi:O-antigen/teichoic acid export membrane protein